MTRHSGPKPAATRYAKAAAAAHNAASYPYLSWIPTRLTRGGAYRAAMLPLPPISPGVGWREPVRLEACDYLADTSAIGRTVEVTADLRMGAGAEHSGSARKQPQSMNRLAYSRKVAYGR